MRCAGVRHDGSLERAHGQRPPEARVDALRHKPRVARAQGRKVLAGRDVAAHDREVLLWHVERCADAPWRTSVMPRGRYGTPLLV